MKYVLSKQTLVLFCCILFGLTLARSETPVIEWQRETLRMVAASGCYARVIRLRNNELLCCYEFNRQCWLKRSSDNMLSWDRGAQVTTYAKGKAANPELIQLQNGRVMLCYNERPDDATAHFTICAVFSDDNGVSWSGRMQLFEAGTSRLDGCWEPAALQYPDGEIQVFFANEAQYTYNNDQEISMLSSKDNGVSWQPPVTVAYRSEARDGMPVPLLLASAEEVVIAIEDNGINGEMKPVILRNSVAKRWRGNVITGNSPLRHAALLQPLADIVYAGAPYICQMPSGITILSVQSRERRAYEEPAVYVGNSDARNFINPSFPLELAEKVAGSWNSLFVKDEQTVVLLSTTSINGQNGIWAIDGLVSGKQQTEP